MISSKGLARLAGLLYLVVAVSGGFSELVARANAKVDADPTATADNIRSSATLFRIAFATDLINTTSFLLVGLILHALLKRVNEPLALAMVMINAVAVSVLSLNMLNHAGATWPPPMRSGPRPWAPTARTPWPCCSWCCTATYLIGQIFFGLFLVPLGYLIHASGTLPKPLGILVTVGGLGYLLALVIDFAIPGDAGSSVVALSTLPAAIGEFSLIGWLLVKGIGERSAVAQG